jgi:hypothetical protein
MKTLSHHPAAGYERSDAQVRFVLIAAGILGSGIIFSLLLAGLLFLRVRNSAGSRGPERSFRHGPAVESDIVRDWRAQDEAVRRHLENYDWVDHQAGLVRIPVQRAMDLMAQDSGKKENGK